MTKDQKMITDLDGLKRLLDSTGTPEEVFSCTNGNSRKEVEKERNRLLRITHPDLHQEDGQAVLAEEVFKTLEERWEQAKRRFKNGTYGTDTPDKPVFSVKHGATTYQTSRQLFAGDLADLYLCTFVEDGGKREGILKISIEPSDNDLVQNEARVLTTLADSEPAALHPFVPHLRDSFLLHQPTDISRQVNILTFAKEITSLRELYSLQEVVQAYPRGIDPRDAAWIYRRLLMALSLAHYNDVTHSSVIPAHVLIHPVHHALILMEWDYAVTNGEALKAVTTSHSDWYPEEVLNKIPPTHKFDLVFAARTMIKLLGGDPLTGNLPTTVPQPMANFFRGCLTARVPNAGVLFQEFDRLLRRLYGPPKFHQFVMPARNQ